MERKATVSLCMIVKNEEKNLERCLNSVKDLVDEIIVVDTGSVDNTKSIAKKYKARIVDYKWNDNFSDARNVSLSKATKDWIFIMDGDDIFEEKDKERFLKLLNSEEYDGYYFKTLSYVNENSKTDYIYNNNIRLVKNKDKYIFMGAIHEQLVSKTGDTDYSKFKVEDIKVHHNGYLPSEIKEKDKRNRNIPIILKELEKDPDNPFHNFNLGSEYFAKGDLDEALKAYNSAYSLMDKNSGYASKLILKRIACLIEKISFNEAIVAIKDAVELGFKSPELYYYRGYIYQKEKRYTLAIKAFNDAIKSFEDKNEEVYINGCGSHRSYLALGEIYDVLMDYEVAIENYENCIRYNSGNIKVYYKLARAYLKQYKDPALTSNYLMRYFDLNEINNTLLFVRVLDYIKQYERGVTMLLMAKNLENSDRVYYELGKNLIYKRDYDKAIEVLNSIPKESPYIDRARVYKIVVSIIKKKSVTLDDLEMIEDKILKKACLLFYFVMIGNEAPSVITNANLVLKEIIDILDTILKTNEVEVFERALNSLNYIESSKVLIELAKLYEENDFKILASEEALRSIKVFGEVDRETIGYLYFSIL